MLLLRVGVGTNAKKVPFLSKKSGPKGVARTFEFGHNPRLNPSPASIDSKTSRQNLNSYNSGQLPIADGSVHCMACNQRFPSKNKLHDTFAFHPPKAN
ncbi:hypothetical protein OIDMADRAFT_20400 [Oidiodendron maius Zn]|uniref:Uncharacterized protein n=1 Tax=Oidiodendron maius (strain Zn) TaxID=913774 RepID=A0A0C3CGP0_OIDMZ|nr:hypothetical protein OIDMADRAFT_20400 [Oidiodendron maius Zn]